MPRYRFHKKDFSIHKDAVNAATLAKNSDLHESTEKTLTPASTGSINTIKGWSPTQIKQTMARSNTIRSVPSFEGSDSSPESKHSNLSSSVHSNMSAASTMAESQYDKTQPSVKLKHESLPQTPSRWSTGAPRVVEPTPEREAPAPVLSPSDNAERGDGQWDSTIGKAGLGKTGRVINKLVSDNEALKRDIKIERLKSDEAKQAAKLLEDKMDRTISDYESRLLEANVTKTLLARKERQVETLTATVQLEKAKTKDAQEKERSWRDEMEKARTEATHQVEEATNYAQLMEGRYNSISSHWRDQGNHVKGALSIMKNDVDILVDERKKDDEKIQTLRELCDQQDNNIKQLRQEKEDISRMFEEYKRAQEDGLKDIKTDARRREEEQERLLKESREALAKLKWALNVKENVKGAQ